MNRDLFLAILSMDSYNRGYGVGVKGLAASGRLGNAVIVNDSLALGGTPNSRVDAGVGFYAIAYNLTGAGIAGLTGTVISYRGSDYTDTNGISLWSRDIWQGWTNAIGYPYGGQPGLALEFYRAVTGNTPYDTPGNVTLTGHSLGGSLAGFVSALSGNRAVLFDHLPFGAGNRLFAPLVRFWKWLETAINRVTYQGVADFNHIARLIQHKLEPNGAFGYSRY
jgi:hypothetical protein